MKRSRVVSLILLSGRVLTACGKSWDNTVVENDNANNTEINWNDAKNSWNWILNSDNDCEKAVQKYLEWADKKWSWEEVKNGDNITVDYIWRLEDWTVFDTSIESVAKACWKYNEARNYSEWLSFEAMWWQMVKWFDEAVIWMRLWQTKTVQFWPEKWYGEYDKEAVVTAPITQFWDISQFNEWDTVDLWMGMPAKILKITDKEITFDFNSELAWKDLIFDITVKSIN